MILPLIFVRLVDGRLWHVAAAVMGDTACGRYVEWATPDDREPETLDGHVPAGAWVCRRCRTALADWLHAVDMAIAADPRNRRADPLPNAADTAPEPPRMSAEAIYAQLLAETDGRPPSEELYVDWMMREHLHPFPSPQPALTTGGVS